VTSGTCSQVNVLTPVGYPAYLSVPYINAGTTKNSGVDIDVRGRVDAGAFGGLVGTVNFTRILQYELAANGQLFDLAGTHGPSSVSGDTGNPRDRASASLTWERGPMTASLSANYTSSFSIVDASSGYPTCLAAIQGRAPSAYLSNISKSVTTLPSQWEQYCSVAHFTDANLYASYTFSDHLQVHASITNLFNSQAPVDLQTYGGGAELAYDAALHQDGAVGRFFLLGATLRF
jgi:iron complex outermembrane recepter protein